MKIPTKIFIEVFNLILKNSKKSEMSFKNEYQLKRIELRCKDEFKLLFQKS